MDLSFQFVQKQWGGTPVLLTRAKTPDLGVLLAAAAAQQAVTPTARFVATALQGPDQSQDMVQTLAQVFAPRKREAVDSGQLGGSFNPVIAEHLHEGQ